MLHIGETNKMYQIDYNNPVHVHFIGIGGISMSGLAQILKEKGFLVSGSDQRESELTKSLESEGIKVYYPQAASNISDDTELVVYTAAIKKDNPEFARAVEMDIAMLTRAELLGQIMKNYETSIAISGTHGKTTTTSMISSILLAADMDPTISVGGMLKEIGGNLRIGKSELFVTEACEYTNSFLSFYPTIGVILNIEEDHMDFFKDIDDIYNSFRQFANLLPESGLLVINADQIDVERVNKDVKCKTVTFSIKDEAADYYAKDISYDQMGCPSFTVYKKGIKLCDVALKVIGEHNVLNALASIAVADHMGISADACIEGFLKFNGTDRRFEYKGKLGGITIIDDYAHHPTEIKATLNAARNYPHERIVCVFQPHTYTRTKAFFDEFCEALSLADVVVLADIYAAREKDTLGISSEDLADTIREMGTEVYYYPSFDEIENYLLKNCMHGDLLITMGAGDIVKVGEKLLGK